MKVIYGLKQIKKYPNPVVALGVFDGVHLGHRRILEAAVRKAQAIKGTSMVLTFWPHPQREESLYSLEHRLRLIRELGIDVCVVINFNKKFAGILAVDFINDILFKRISAHYVYVGKNFRFGKNSEGNYKTLERLSGICNFKLKIFEVARTDNRPISSTFIRTLIKSGKLSLAQKLLTRPVSILGTVIKGVSLAKKLGFPTANINPHHEVIPPQGVYAVRIIFDNRGFKGVCYIGNKPTLRIKKPLPKYIEVYIFNFNKNIYAKFLEVQFIRKIRNEEKFNSLDALAKQIKKDVETAKAFLRPPLIHPQYMPLRS